MPDNIKRLRVGTGHVGIRGLSQALNKAKEECAGLSDEQTADFLFKTLSEKNYLAPPAEKQYKEAFFREFCVFMGKSRDRDQKDGVMEILVLGPGCPQCDGLEMTVMEVLSELDVQALVDHVRDQAEIASFKVFGVPALVINGEIKCVGLVPPRVKIKKWVLDHLKNQDPSREKEKGD